MPKYIDRGLVKWGAFDALNGYSSMLSEMRYRLGKRERPVLSEDRIEELNRSLQEAWMEKKEIDVRYYHDGYYRHSYGFIARVDFEHRQIVLSTKERLKAEDIVEITVL